MEIPILKYHDRGDIDLSPRSVYVVFIFLIIFKYY